MGFLSSLFRSRDAPQNRTFGSAYSENSMGNYWIFAMIQYPWIHARMLSSAHDLSHFNRANIPSIYKAMIVFMSCIFSYSSASLYCSALGRILLIDKAEEEIKAYLANTELSKRTIHTKVSSQELLDEVRSTCQEISSKVIGWWFGNAADKIKFLKISLLTKPCDNAYTRAYLKFHIVALKGINQHAWISQRAVSWWEGCRFVGWCLTPEQNLMSGSGCWPSDQ